MIVWTGGAAVDLQSESDQVEAEGTWVSVNYYRDTMCHSHSPRTLIVNHCALYKVSTEA